MVHATPTLAIISTQQHQPEFPKTFIYMVCAMPTPAIITTQQHRSEFPTTFARLFQSKTLIGAKPSGLIGIWNRLDQSPNSLFRRNPTQVLTQSLNHGG
ncbi:hypothetical protein AB3S75_014259 [Citrus x aurantiifolia]